MNIPVHLVSVIGGDFPQEYLDMMTDKGINVDGVEMIKEGKTFFWSGRYHNDLNSRDTLATELNVLENFDPKIPASAQDAEILLLGNLHPAVQLSVLEKMEKRPKLVVLDTMNFWMDHTWDLLMEMITKTDVISINDEEARQLSGEYSLVKAAKKIHEMGPQFVIIKKGEHGAILFHKGRIFAIPALPLEEVFDPTGAGDTFAGGFVSYLAKKGDFSFENMKAALIAGSAMASFTVEKFGTERLVEITEKDIVKRVNDFKELTTFDVVL
jgi:sugar/nucleoside kinase (ribokinase family)